MELIERVMGSPPMRFHRKSRTTTVRITSAMFWTTSLQNALISEEGGWATSRKETKRRIAPRIRNMI
ncbi:MAG: hypothetical protein AB1714_31870 [Acidobacteriota bacterium]